MSIGVNKYQKTVKHCDVSFTAPAMYWVYSDFRVKFQEDGIGISKYILGVF